ncbi:mannosyl transferase [Pochonia chlamydosporia 170]|uniref:Mannosyl transferase n=1 Tax=Pochonia chlamydosporia 170 TaxID=1380566 RepID=A0A179G3L3_METCM|nr:mannosyl transferase [Pochonia chlamydosporia 170]OAQ72462.1 mannosyl transferase [Pochonia chlamydosporia 170]
MLTAVFLDLFGGFGLSVLFTIACLALMYFAGQHRSKQSISQGETSKSHASIEKNTKTGLAEKIVSPICYKIRSPRPYPQWSIHQTKPLPYRAFRYGPKYNITMGLRTIEPDEWIELDNHFPKYHADKAARIQERGEKCIKTDPAAFPAAIELLEELVSYLPARYPTLFKRTSVGIDNPWSGESFNILERPLRENPMAICARLIQDDLALMLEQPVGSGTYRLLAGCILLPGFWRLSDKFGMSLSDIHTSGNVPSFKEKLEKGMIKFFQRLKPDVLYSRNNYFIQVDDSLAWSHSIGAEDNPTVSWSTAEKDTIIENHWFRSERQTLRRLPKTGAICFTIRTYFHPVTEIVQEEYVPGRLASAVRSWDDNVSIYKGREKYGDILLEYLDKKHQEQIENGLDIDCEDEVRQYPW